ncbi:thiol reductant ABC exporter subunit CydD [Paenibacillus daejeonensis]|uniref:thiol reductant ABC exporter subunit CydD n=1 Tax=Paenibacillus daejeonensis TaxID=135193 RepID=UPI0003625326|nr:thiol reductant ABC exporter subunit CydD [Paenibacillus daejeonensis]
MMKKLFEQVQGTRKLFAISILLGVLGGLLLIAQAVYMARVVNGAFLGGQGLSVLLPLLYVLLGIIALRAVLHSAGDYAASAMAQRIKDKLRLQLIRKLSELGPEYGKGERSGELVGTVYEGVEQLESYLSKYLPQLALSMFVPAAVFFMTLSVDRLSAIIFGITLPLLVLFMILIGKTAKSKTDKQFKLLGRLGGHFHDVLRGLPTLAIFNRSKAQIEIIDRIGEQHRRSAMGTLRLAFLSALAMELFASLSTAVVAVFLGLRLVDGQIGFEAAFLVLLLAPEFYTPIRTLGAQFHAGQNGMSAFSRMVRILQEEVPGWPERPDAAPLPAFPEGYRIQFERVTVRRSGAERDAVHELSFTLEPGERIALVGPSGAGKSTVLELLQGYIRPTSGRILIDGIDMSELSMHEWRSRLSALPQRAHLFAGTVADNIRLSRPEATDAEVRAAATLAQADGFIRLLPQGYATPLGEAVRLSGGQAQRIALARTLLRPAPLLLLDEPTAGLDVLHETALTSALAPVLTERMSIMAAHRLHTVRQADRVIVLAEGQLVEQGAPAELLAGGGLYARLWHAAGGRDGAEMGPTAPAPGPVDEQQSAMAEPDLAVQRTAAGLAQPNLLDVAARSTAGPERDMTTGCNDPGGPLERRANAVQTVPDSPPGDSVGRAQSPLRRKQKADTGQLGGFAVLRRMLRFIMPHKWRLLAAVLIGFATVAANTGLMGVSGYLIAKAALRPENILMLYVPIVGVRFFGIARGVLRYVERLVSHDLTFRILKQLRTWLYAKVEPQGVRLLERRRSGDLLGSVLSDVEEQQNLYLRVIAPPVIALLAAALGFVVLARGAVSLGWLLLGMMALTGIAVPWLGHVLGRRGSQAFVETRSRLYEETSDLLAGMEPLTLYGRSGWQEERIARLQQQLNRHQRVQHAITACTGGIMSGLAHLTMWLILAAAIPLTASGLLPGYMIPALMLAGFACFEAILPLPQAFQHYGRTMAAGGRLLQLADEADRMNEGQGTSSKSGTLHPATAAECPPMTRHAAAAATASRPAASDRQAVSGRAVDTEALPSVQERPLAAPPPFVLAGQPSGWRIELRGLSYRYAEGEAYALQDIRLSLVPGRRIAVVGESGAGKSTLLQLLLKLRAYEEGSVTVGGLELSSLACEEARAQFAVVSQQVQLFNATVADNLRLGRPDAPMSELREAARIAMLEPVIAKLPQGYDTVIGEWGAKLSGGERQRLALARALVMRTPALLFDEPGTGLDPLTELAFGEKLQPVLADKAVLWITHRLSGLEQMDEIVVLQAGRICERGTHAELVQARGAYYRMWSLQQQDAWAKHLA